MRKRGRPRSEETLKILALKPGEWLDLGAYTPNAKRKIHERLKYLRLLGEISKNVGVIHNTERRIIVFHVPTKPVGVAGGSGTGDAPSR